MSLGFGSDPVAGSLGGEAFGLGLGLADRLGGEAFGVGNKTADLLGDEAFGLGLGLGSLGCEAFGVFLLLAGLGDEVSGPVFGADLVGVNTFWVDWKAVGSESEGKVG